MLTKWHPVAELWRPRPETAEPPVPVEPLENIIHHIAPDEEEEGSSEGDALHGLFNETHCQVLGVIMTARPPSCLLSFAVSLLSNARGRAKEATAR